MFCCKNYLCNGSIWWNSYLLPAIGIYLIFVFGGAFVIKAIEEPNDKRMVSEMKEAYKSFVRNQSNGFNETDLRRLLSETFGYLRNGENVDILWDESSEERNWTIAESILFVVSIMVMIGYGNMTPATAAGKLFVIFFAIFGIPVTLFLLSVLIENLSSVTSKLAQRLNKAGGRWASFSWGIYISTLLVSLLVFFFVIPSVIIFQLEGRWSYLDCFYYCFVSLTTIGFGDYVPGRDRTNSDRNAYVISMSFYLIIGVAVVMTVVGEFCKSSCLRGIMNRQESREEEPLNSEKRDARSYQSFGDS